MEVLTLMQSKNRCLEKFLSYSEAFLHRAEKGDISTLQSLQDQREVILKAIDLYDRKISQLISELSPIEKTDSLIQAVKQILKRKEDLIQSILVLDQKIISIVEEEKKRLHKEISDSTKHIQLFNKFKSKWIAECGEKLDGKL